MNLVLIKAVETALLEKTALKGWEHLSTAELDMVLTFCALGAWWDKPTQGAVDLVQAMLSE